MKDKTNEELEELFRLADWYQIAILVLSQYLSRSSLLGNFFIDLLEGEGVELVLSQYRYPFFFFYKRPAL